MKSAVLEKQSTQIFCVLMHVFNKNNFLSIYHSFFNIMEMSVKQPGTVIT